MPETIGAYRITGIIGQGGMGTVFRGQRMSGDFEHDVAIKVIKPKVLSDELVERFARERQTLARLSHPNIARLYDGGTTPDGAPYIIMEYIDGVPITLWCEEEELPRDQRLALFLDGCSAVAHAHRNLIIHRDITPSNMLVTREGAVRLIDFGIAKPFTGEEEEHLEASIPSLSFTPGFAAPERRRGAIANTLSDIFSLGRLLEAIVPATMRGPDLQAIIGKAAAQDPARRYATVDALIDDINRMKSGHTVSARPATSGYRLSKYVTRHKAGVLLGTTALAALIGAFGLTLAQYLRAESALDSANARFEQSRDLARTMVFEIYDDVALLGGSLEVRARMADVLKAYVDELAADRYAPDDILMDVAVHYNRLSDLYGGIGIANLGDAETSYSLLRDAEAVLDRLLERDPDNVKTIDELVWTLRLMTNQELIYNLDVDAARRANDKARVLVTRGLTLPGATDTPLANRFWNVRSDRLKILGYANDQATALEEVRRYRAELAAPGNAESLNGYDRKVAYFASLEGETLYELQRYEEAVPPLEDALAIQDRTLAEAPDNYYYLVQVMRLNGLIAPSARLSGNNDRSIEAARRAVAVAEQIKALDPEDANGDHYLASQLEQLAKSLAATGGDDEAEDTIERAIATRSAVAGRYPDVLNHRRDLALTYKDAGIVYGQIGKADLQCSYLREAMAIMRALQDQGTLTDYDEGDRMEELTALLEQHCAG
ncbi:serine/threonine protein kinase [Aquisalinus flavus]|nr:serine/threonine protein kinase [Aquisalinus flavus]